MKHSEFLTRAECNALRGIAIIGIFLHNFCHWLPGIVRENEYLYHEQNVTGLDGILSAPDVNFPLHLLSFFGHYGVPIFLFLSAYGLVMKYERQEEQNPIKIKTMNANWWTKFKVHLANSTVPQFLGSHFAKLFHMMIIGFALFLMVDAITPGRHRYALIDIVAQLGLFNNVLPHPNQVIWPGPYWFFGLMMQLYIVYRLLLYRRHWGWTVGLMAVCMILQVCCAPESEVLNRLRYNFISGMLPFGYGLLVARMPMRMSQGYNWIFGLVSLYFVYSLSHGYFSWFFVPLFVCSAGFCLIKVVPQWLLKPLVWMGDISAALFVLHPITRKIFIPISRQDGLYTGLALYVVASIVLAWLLNESIKGVNKVKEQSDKVNKVTE